MCSLPSALCKLYLSGHAERVAASIVQTADMGVEVYIRKILEEQCGVDACARLVDAECKSSLSEHLATSNPTSRFQDRQHMDDVVRNFRGSFVSLNIGK